MWATVPPRLRHSYLASLDNLVRLPSLYDHAHLFTSDSRSRNIKIIIVPAILLIIAVMTSVLGVHPDFRRTACVVFGLEAILNALLAVLISGKIWVSGRRPMFRRVAVVVLKSGVIMSVGMVVTLITFATEVSSSQRLVVTMLISRADERTGHCVDCYGEDYGNVGYWYRPCQYWPMRIFLLC